MSCRRGCHRSAVLFLLLVFAFLLITLGETQVASQTHSSSPTVISPVKGETEAKVKEQAEKMYLIYWIPFIGTIAAALIAGLFALYGLRRSAIAQRALEMEKLVAARRETELAQEREASIRFRQSQVLPFLEHLNKALTRSYAVVQITGYLGPLCGYVPQLLRHTNQVVHEWAGAMEKMDERRMQMLLAIEQSRVEIVASFLAKFVTLARAIFNTRHMVCFKKASVSDLWKIHGEYARVGYQLMMEIKDALIRAPVTEVMFSEEDKRKLADSLTRPLAESSMVAVPYGSNQDFSWVAIWEIDTSREWQEFEDSMTDSNLEQLEEGLKGLASKLYEQPEVIETKLQRVVSGASQTSCLSAKFPSAERLRKFLDADLPKYRQEYSVLWLSFRSPLEFIIGVDSS